MPLLYRSAVSPRRKTVIFQGGIHSGSAIMAQQDSAEASSAAALLVIQNMMHLNKDLKLPVAYKFSEIKQHGMPEDWRTFLVIVHVMADHAFKRYLGQCSRSDLMLFRGLLLKVGHASNHALPRHQHRACHAASAPRLVF